MRRVRETRERLGRLDPRVWDAALGIAFAVAAVAQSVHDGFSTPHDLTAAIGTGLPLAWRRRLPNGVYLTQVAFAIYGARQPGTISLLATFVGLFSASVYSRWPVVPLLVPVIGAIVLGVMVPESAPSVPAWALELVGGMCLWLAGSAVRQRQARADALADRARQLEHERELGTQLALADERQRIARELHDVIAHSVSVMVVQTGAARTLVRKQPERATNALLAAEAAGRDALAELRNMLGLLTQPAPTSESQLSPQPGLDQLERLVERVEQAGLPVQLRVLGTRRALPAGLDLTAYRIVQEALTNALRYAPGAETQVLVEFDESELRLSVVDHGAVDAAVVSNGTGHGLFGMQERVAMYGGDLQVGRRTEGGFAVRARLPLVST
ncbi:MAG: two-component sensor histidine kinase [Chloroflexi bacterium]|nr:two-component sensor histidine kinase [Chloroflexota bacterium]